MGDVATSLTLCAHALAEGRGQMGKGAEAAGLAVHGGRDSRRWVSQRKVGRLLEKGATLLSPGAGQDPCRQQPSSAPTQSLLAGGPRSRTLDVFNFRDDPTL